jgi:hypothetical protein
VNFADPSGLNRLMCDVYTEEGGCADQRGGGGFWSIGLNFNWNGEYYSPVPVSVWVPTPQPAGGGGGGGGGSDPIAIAAQALAKVSSALSKAASTQNIFTAEELDCISGIETGRTWDPTIVASNGRVGLFQFDRANWIASGTGISWNNGAAAKDPETAAEVALVLLYRKLGYSGVHNPTNDAVQKAIDNFGEGDGRYGKAVMDCAKQLKNGDFRGAYTTLQDYANWVAGGR